MRERDGRRKINETLNYASSARRKPLSGYRTAGSWFNGFFMVMADGRTRLVDLAAAVASHRSAGGADRGPPSLIVPRSEAIRGPFSLCPFGLYGAHAHQRSRRVRHTHGRPKLRRRYCYRIIRRHRRCRPGLSPPSRLR